MYLQNNDVTYFDFFGVEHIPKEIRIFISKKTSKQIFLEYKHMIYFCIGFVERLTEFTNLFSPNNLKKNDDIILKYWITNV